MLLLGGADYRAFNEIITLAAGATGFSYQVEILSDDIAEFPELFQVQLSIEGADSILTLDEENSVANVTITDIISKLT